MPLISPLPEIEIVTLLMSAEVKLAFAATYELLAPACTTHIGEVPQTDGVVQPTNCAPLAGCAVSVTSVGDARLYEHVPVQVVPIGAA